MRLIICILLFLVIIPVQSQERSTTKAVIATMLIPGAGFKYMGRADYAAVFFGVESAQIALCSNKKLRNSMYASIVAVKLVEVIGVLNLSGRVDVAYWDGPRVRYSVALN